LGSAVFLELDEASVAHAANDDVYDFVIDIAANNLALELIAEGLIRLGASPRP